ncbi:MAG: hypothetical protein HKN43_14480 [Rhodothermales bacterium]|nr:hypothetical protein [Rhodothermales bacterium]
MKYNLGLFALLAIFLVSTNPAQAQRSPEAMNDRIKKQNVELMATLDLNEEQRPVVEKILNDEMEMRSKLMEERGGGGGFGAIREKMEKLSEETSELLGDVLTEDQMASFLDFRAKNRRGGRPGEPPGPRRGQTGTL